MSAANSAAAPLAAAITLDELEGLIKRLGMLGSAHDGEVLAAARFVCRWLDQHDTDWRTLLTPEEEVGVTGVVAADPDAERMALEARVQAAFKDGFRQGIERMAAQVKAQGQMAARQAAQTNPYAGLGAAWSGAAASWQQTTGQAHQPAQAASGGVAGAGAPTPLGNPWTAGTWQAVAWELVERDRAGIPGVFRGSKEQQFVADVLGRGFRSLTNAQEVWLRDIAGRSGMSW